MNVDLQSIFERLSLNHKNALLWFHQRQGQDVPWPQPLADGTFLVNKAKGIHKPAGLQYALSVRESLSGPYDDHPPEVHSDGSWTYRYFQEQPDPAKRDSMFTNVALLKCRDDEVPVGVLRQVKAKPNPQYRVLGLALVREWKDGYFRLEGFSPAGTIRQLEVIGNADSKQEETFNPENIEDARQRIMSAIVRRQGQGKFRATVLSAYSNRCAISGCDLPDALEAAHIFRYLGPETNLVTNGLLLRSDLHTLYDLGLIAIDPATMKVVIAPRLQSSVYTDFAGKTVRVPNMPEEHPSHAALKKHADWAKTTWQK
ncbi:HNH endonuclease [Noviherbaspirillum malthae]|uniref:HNH endonuclease n=1 Tax=Noviherbaspirillum malthae TaxID=1260987 RepID=UPI00188F4B6B|nr:HNH endonuclease signature motif containing protein [Noviherbaspirillum malthae]